MTATLTFNLPEEAQEQLDALNGWRWRNIVVQLDERWRQQLKHDLLLADQQKVLEEERNWLRTSLADANLNMYGEG